MFKPAPKQKKLKLSDLRRIESGYPGRPSLAVLWIPAALIIALVVPALLLTRLDAGAAPAPQAPGAEEVLSNGQFVWGPNVGDFEIEPFLAGIDSPLTPYAVEVESTALYYSINPRVLLALLDVRHGIVTALPPGTAPQQIRAWIEETGLAAYTAFYDHLYTWGDMAPAHAEKSGSMPKIRFADGVEVQIETPVSSASYAVANAVAAAQESTALIAPSIEGGSGGFVETFDLLFPEVDRLDASNDILPASVPPADLFQFPFPLGGKWRFGGPHNWAGGGGYPFSSIDFNTGWGSSTPFPYHYSVAAAQGTGRVFAPNPAYSDLPCWVKVDHSGSWTTYYYHLQNVRPPGGIGSVMPNQPLGTIATEICNGGFATGAHVHFTLLYNGAFVSLEGVKLSGWTVHVGPSDEPYTSGSLERDGVVLTPYSLVENDYLEYYGDGVDYSMRFFGNASGDVDRVKIRLDDPDTDYFGPTADVGMSDFTIEFWIRANAAQNTAPAISCGSNQNWKQGNVFLDSSRENMARGLGASLAGGKVAFGLSGSSGNLTLCSTSVITDGEWHHVALQRNRFDGTTYPDGYAWLYVDGVLEAQGTGPTGDLSYSNSATPSDSDDPFLFLGAGKASSSPPFNGWLDEMRFSRSIRYTASTITPPGPPFEADSYTIAMYRFDEGSGSWLFDTSGFLPTSTSWPGAPSNGILYYGGTPAGPVWDASDLLVLPYKIYLPLIAR